MDDNQNSWSSQSYGGYQGTDQTQNNPTSNLEQGTTATPPLGQETPQTPPPYTPHSSFVPNDQPQHTPTPLENTASTPAFQQNTQAHPMTDPTPQVPPYSAMPDAMQTTPSADYHPQQVNPMAATPPMTENSYVPPTPTSTRKMPKALFAILLVLFVLVGLTLTTGVLIAYEKIPVSNTALQHQIARIVFKIPFIPETPKFVLMESLAAQKNVTSGHTEASFAIQGSGISSFLTAVPMEMSLSGDYDYSDLENPKSDFTINFANQLEFDAITLDNTYYFRLTKIPTILLAYLGLSDEASFSELQNKWVEIDSTVLNTDAKETLTAESEDDNKERISQYERIALAVLEDDILPQMTLSDESLDGVRVHKLTMEMNGEEFNQLVKQTTIHIAKLAHEEGLIDELPENLEENFDDSSISEVETVRFSLWIDEVNYYISKGEFYMKSSYDQSFSQLSRNSLGAVPTDQSGEKTTLELVASARFSKQGEQVQINKPADVISVEEYMSIVSTVFGFDAGSLFGISPEFSDAKAKVQLLSTSTNVFYATEGRYPTSIVELATSNLTSVDLAGDLTTYEINFSISADNEAYLVYSRIEDPNNEDAPYYVVVGSSTGNGSIENLNAQDLNALRVSLGLPADTQLEYSSSLGAPSLPNLIY